MVAILLVILDQLWLSLLIPGNSFEGARMTACSASDPFSVFRYTIYDLTND